MTTAAGARSPALGTRIAGRSPLLRLQSDEKLVGLIRRGSVPAFETLVARYQTRLLAFCRHMLGSREDAEDVLQEVFAAAFGAIQADDRPLTVRPWLYRIARNRSLNHLRRTQAVGVDDMDVHLAEAGLTTADQAHRREEFRVLLEDVSRLAETQRTALILREMEALSYEQISEAMETTVPAVKSLLVRARIGLAEAAEARALSCEQVRFELGEAAEGLVKLSPAVKRHLKDCDRCASFRAHLRSTNKALAAVLPVAPLIVLKKLILGHLGGAAAGGGSASGGTAGAGGAGAAAGGSLLGGSGVGGLLSAGFGAAATKTAAGIAAAAFVTAGAVEVRNVTHDSSPAPRTTAPALASAPPRALPAPKPAPAHAAAHHVRRLPAPVRHASPPRPPAKVAPKPAKAKSDAAPAPTPAPAKPALTPKTPTAAPAPTAPAPKTTTTAPPPSQPAEPTTTVSDSTTVGPPPANTESNSGVQAAPAGGDQSGAPPPSGGPTQPPPGGPSASAGSVTITGSTPPPLP